MRKIAHITVGLLLCAGLGWIVYRLTHHENRKPHGVAGQSRDRQSGRASRPQIDFPPVLSEQRPSLSVRVNGLPLSADARILMGLEGDPTNKAARIAAMNRMDRNLQEADVKGLIAFLDVRTDEQPSMTPMEFNALKNNTVDILMRQDRLPEGLGGILANMYGDPKHDEVWRDYCIQCMTPYYERHWPDPTDIPIDDEERVRMDTAYQHAVSQKYMGFSGTALIGLEALSRRYKDLDRESVKDAASELALDETTCETTRITALRICGLMGDTRIRETARMLAQAGETEILRLAALATIGDIGVSSDTALLESLAKSTDARISRTAAMALDKLQKRLGTSDKT